MRNNHLINRETESNIKNKTNQKTFSTGVEKFPWGIEDTTELVAKVWPGDGELYNLGGRISSDMVTAWLPYNPEE